MIFSEAKTRYAAQKEHPYCFSFYKVQGGYACFHSWLSLLNWLCLAKRKPKSYEELSSKFAESLSIIQDELSKINNNQPTTNQQPTKGTK